MQPPPPYRDYLRPEDRDQPTPPQVIGDQPRPGHGAVFVTVDRHGNWHASWQDDHGPSIQIAACDGTRDHVLQWALAQPAATRWIQNVAPDEIVPLT